MRGRAAVVLLAMPPPLLPRRAPAAAALNLCTAANRLYPAPSPPGILPADPAALAKARLWAEVWGSTVGPAQSAILQADTKAKVAEATEKMGGALTVRGAGAGRGGCPPLRRRLPQAAHMHACAHCSQPCTPRVHPRCTHAGDGRVSAGPGHQRRRRFLSGRHLLHRRGADHQPAAARTDLHPGVPRRGPVAPGAGAAADAARGLDARRARPALGCAVRWRRCLDGAAVLGACAEGLAGTAGHRRAPTGHRWAPTLPPHAGLRPLPPAAAKATAPDEAELLHHGQKFSKPMLD